MIMFGVILMLFGFVLFRFVEHTDIVIFPIGFGFVGAACIILGTM